MGGRFGNSLVICQGSVTSKWGVVFCLFVWSYVRSKFHIVPWPKVRRVWDLMGLGEAIQMGNEE